MELWLQTLLHMERLCAAVEAEGAAEMVAMCAEFRQRCLEDALLARKGAYRLGWLQQKAADYGNWRVRPARAVSQDRAVPAKILAHRRPPWPTRWKAGGAMRWSAGCASCARSARGASGTWTWPSNASTCWTSSSRTSCGR